MREGARGWEKNEAARGKGASANKENLVCLVNEYADKRSNREHIARPTRLKRTKL